MLSGRTIRMLDRSGEDGWHEAWITPAGSACKMMPAQHHTDHSGVPFVVLGCGERESTGCCVCFPS